MSDYFVDFLREAAHLIPTADKLRSQCNIEVYYLASDGDRYFGEIQAGHRTDASLDLLVTCPRQTHPLKSLYEFTSGWLGGVPKRSYNYDGDRYTLVSTLNVTITITMKYGYPETVLDDDMWLSYDERSF